MPDRVESPSTAKPRKKDVLAAATKNIVFQSLISLYEKMRRFHDDIRVKARFAVLAGVLGGAAVVIVPMSLATSSRIPRTLVAVRQELLHDVLFASAAALAIALLVFSAIFRRIEEEFRETYRRKSVGDDADWIAAEIAGEMSRKLKDEMDREKSSRTKHVVELHRRRRMREVYRLRQEAECSRERAALRGERQQVLRNLLAEFGIPEEFRLSAPLRPWEAEEKFLSTLTNDHFYHAVLRPNDPDTLVFVQEIDDPLTYEQSARIAMKTRYSRFGPTFLVFECCECDGCKRKIRSSTTYRVRANPGNFGIRREDELPQVGGYYQTDSPKHMHPLGAWYCESCGQQAVAAGDGLTHRSVPEDPGLKYM